MPQPLTLMILFLALAAGLSLFQMKHACQALDRDVARVVAARGRAAADADRLRAEWALLNDPVRLAGLAVRRLALRPVAVDQYVPLAGLGRRLPLPTGAEEATPRSLLTAVAEPPRHPAPR